MGLVIPAELDVVCFLKSKHLCEGFQELHSGQRRAWFKDNRSKILAVAHLDSVNPRGLRWSGQVKLDASFYFNPFLDDRLGAYTILKVLPTLGITPDILFTTDEEIGQSTADLFKIDYQYNWIVSFDRRGEDVVCYDYKDDDLDKKLKSCGFDVGWGSFSDICRLQDLKCKAFNVGVGYENEHSPRSFFIMEVYERQIARFVKFYTKFKDERLPHVKSVTPARNFGVSGVGFGRGNPRSPLNGTGYGVGYPDDAPFGVSPEYKKWADLRDAREKKERAKIHIPASVGKPSSFAPIPDWCPVCSRRVVEGSCSLCGALVFYGNAWVPDSLANEDKYEKSLVADSSAG